MVIDGGPAMTDLDGFGKAIAASLFRTAVSLPAFRRFADRVLGEGHDFRVELTLGNQLRGLIIDGAKGVDESLAGTKGSVSNTS